MVGQICLSSALYVSGAMLDQIFWSLDELVVARYVKSAHKKRLSNQRCRDSTINAKPGYIQKVYRYLAMD